MIFFNFTNFPWKVISFVGFFRCWLKVHTRTLIKAFHKCRYFGILEQIYILFKLPSGKWKILSILSFSRVLFKIMRMTLKRLFVSLHTRLAFISIIIVMNNNHWCNHWLFFILLFPNPIVQKINFITRQMY